MPPIGGTRPPAQNIAHRFLRCVSLTSFVFGTLKRVLDIHLLEEIPFSKSQQAELKGKSTKTARHEGTSMDEWSLQRKQHILAAILDIKGIFNNINVKSAKEAQKKNKNVLRYG